MLKDAPRKKMGKTNDLPPEVLDQVNRLLVEGMTYEEISGFLAEQGYEISKTAVGRYGRDFLEFCRRLRINEEKSRALASDEKSGLLLEEAASRLFALKILESLLSGEIDLVRLPRLLSEFAKLQSSNVQRERLRREFRKRTEETAEEVAQSARSGGLSDKTAEEIRRKILGIAE
ncbi:MAG: phage protein Gp27 family protein [Syntrophobacteraceae bacterium]